MPDLEGAALDDVRVIELSDERTQFTGKLLADMGADVILVEPQQGSMNRRVGPFRGDEPGANSSLTFWYYNTNKRSVTLGAESESGRALLKRLCQDADVLLHGCSPGSLVDMGLSHDALMTANPRLIITAVTPFGLDGPDSPNGEFKATDIVHLALGGMMSISGYSETDDSPPIAAGGGQAWHIGGLWAAIGTGMALVERDQSDLGQVVDVSVHDACSICTELAFSFYEAAGEIRVRNGGRGAMLCADGRYVTGSLPRWGWDSRPKVWRAVVEWLDSKGKAEDLTDDRFDELDALDAAEWDHVDDVLRRFALTQTAEEVMDKGQQLGFAWCIIFSPEELTTDPHLAARGFYVDVPHPELGETFKYPGAPYLFSATPWGLRRRAPLLGEHNHEVYGDEFNISTEEIVALAEAGVI